MLAAVALTFLRCKCAMNMKVALAVFGLVLVALLKYFEARFWGVVVMGAAVIILCFLPWLDRSPARSIRYRPNWHKVLLGIFVVWFLILMVLGVMLPGPLFASSSLAWLTNELVAMVGTLFYFGFFLLMPWWSQLGTFKPVPDRVVYKPH